MWYNVHLRLKQPTRISTCNNVTSQPQVMSASQYMLICMNVSRNFVYPQDSGPGGGGLKPLIRTLRTETLTELQVLEYGN